MFILFLFNIFLVETDMYIRAKNSTNKKSKYIQVVDSYRDNDGKNKQTVIKHVGSAPADDNQKIEQLKNIGRGIIKMIEDFDDKQLKEYLKNNLKLKHPWTHPIKGKLFSLNSFDKSSNYHTREIKRINVGFHEVIGTIFDNIGFNKLINNQDKNNEKLNLILRNIVITRIANPSSKRAAAFYMKEHFDINIDLNYIYRLMDIIDSNAIKQINKISYDSAKQLTNNEISTGFYDVTTLYFESFTEDDFKQNGFSKDGKFNQPQVLLGILTSKEGLPIGYKAFEGSKFEGHTLKTMLEELKLEYNLKSLTVVADAGMLNQKNLDYLKSNGYKYIVGGKIKTLSSKLKKQVLDKKKYKSLDKNSSLKYQKIKNGDQQIIITHSEKRAKKDASDRDKYLKMLKNHLSVSTNPKTLIPNRKSNKYLSMECSGVMELSEEKIYESSKWDGLHGIRTNISPGEMSIQEILDNYKNLWRVEESFRITKHDLSIRPIFHWTPRRIKSHISMVYISFTCIKTLMYILEKQSSVMSCRKIVEVLKGVQASIIEDNHSKKTILFTFHNKSRCIHALQISKKTS